MSGLSGRELNIAEQIADFLCERTDLPEAECNRLGAEMVPWIYPPDAALLASLETLRDLNREVAQQMQIGGDARDARESVVRTATADDLHRVIEGARG